MTPGQRQRVVDFANTHGPQAASRKFRVPMGTVASWQHRARQAEARHQRWLAQARQGEAEAQAEREPAADPEPIGRPVADPDPSDAELARRMAHNICLRCGGVGWVEHPAVVIGGYIRRPARRSRCQDCGGVPRTVQVVEHPPAAWAAALAHAGDMGFGWDAELWGRIRRGEVDPLGYRYSGPTD